MADTIAVPMGKPLGPGTPIITPGQVPSPSQPAATTSCSIVESEYDTGETNTTLDTSHNAYFVKTVVADDGTGGIGASGTFGFVSYLDKTIVLPGAVDPESVEANWSASEGSYKNTTTTQTFVADSFRVRYAVDGEQQETKTDTVAIPCLTIQLLPYRKGAIMPGTLRFTLNGKTVSDRVGQGYLYWDDGTVVGQVDYYAKVVYLTIWTPGTGVLTLTSCITTLGIWSTQAVVFRVAGAPLQPGSLIVQATKSDGEVITATVNSNGYIIHDDVTGFVDQENGVADLQFGHLTLETSLTEAQRLEPWYNLEDIVDGHIWVPYDVFPSSIRYSAVVYTFLPLDASLLGLDPVRLPTDGRVPIFKLGQVIVIAEELSQSISSLPVPADVVQLSATFVADASLTDTEGATVPSTFYTLDRKLGTLTFLPATDWTDFTAPLTAVIRLEDMSLITDVQINGTVKVAAPIARAFSAETAKVSSALIFGDMVTRYFNLFHQFSWISVWSEAVIGSDTSSKYDDVSYPILVANESAIEQRWAIVFTSATTFKCLGETRGQVATGDVYTNFEPVNGLTNKPYFRIDHRGWGGGWATGNVMRFNTEAAKPFWISRCILQGEPTNEEDVFCIQARGDSE